MISVNITCSKQSLKITCETIKIKCKTRLWLHRINLTLIIFDIYRLYYEKMIIYLHGNFVLINLSYVFCLTLEHSEKSMSNSFASSINETDESVWSNTHYWSNCHCYALVSVSFPFYCRFYWPCFYWCYTDLMFQRSQNAPRISSPFFYLRFHFASSFFAIDRFIHRINLKLIDLREISLHRFLQVIRR